MDAASKNKPNSLSQLLATAAVEYPIILTPDQAAALLQVPKQTIYDWSSRGLLDGCKARVGKHLRILRDSLLEQVFNRGHNEKR